MAYNIIVTGTKSFADYELLKKKCDQYLNALTDGSESDSESIKIITGDDGNAEKMAQRYANENGLESEIYLLEYETYGSLAAKERNTNMVNNADGAICFWNGSSRGVKMTIDLCRKKGIACEIIRYNKK